MRTLFVIAAALCGDAFTDEEDREIPGRYAVEVPEELEDDKAASVALDAFHESIAVECLDDFEFTVTNAEGLPLEEDGNHQGYSGSTLAGDVYRVE